MPATFRIYSSSAGSGKTYQLTKEYLKLALGADDPSYFKRILAITFTNDAAGEMKERIIGSLRRFAYPPDNEPDTLLAEIAAELAAEGTLTAQATPEQRQQLLRERAGRTFRLVLYHYADFAVSTIDSFVQRIVTAFTRELGLPATFEVELDSATVLQSAVALLLDRVNRDPNAKLLSRTISDFALSKADEGRSWNNLPAELVEFGQFLLSEPVHEAVEQLQKLSLADYRRLHEGLRQRKQEIEDAFRQVAELAVAAVEEAGVTDSDLYQGRSGLLGYVSKWEERLQPDKEANTYVRATVEQDKWYSSKVKTTADKARVDAVKPVLLTAYETLEKLRATLLPDYLLVTGMLPYVFQVSLLSELNKAVDQLSRERGVVLIAEFNRRIAQIVLREPVPFLYERMGEKYQHLLIDEFQDTSVLQWNNLLPLVENAVAGGHLSLAVGDAKQAIYRWRGGEMEQILRLYQNQTEHLYASVQDLELRELLAGRYLTLDQTLEPASLTVNYRSAAGIIRFNNDFFRHISQTHPQLPLVQGIYDEGFAQREPHPPAPSPVERGSQTAPNASAWAEATGNGFAHESFEPQGGTVGEFVLTADASSWEKTSAFSQEMRRHPTQVEDVLWQALRNNQLGVKFQRQHIIGKFIVDFICIPHSLVVEVDGDVHGETSQAEYNDGRTHELSQLGYQVLRFHNNEVLHQLPQVLQAIQQRLAQTKPQPSAHKEENEAVAVLEAQAERTALPESSGSPLSAGEGGRGGEAHVELLFTEDDAPACRYDAGLGTFTPELLPGYAPGQALDYDESTLYLTLQLVERVLADGFRLQDVAVLCRRRDQSRRVAKFLKERGYDIISADSLSLEFAEVVNLLVALFRVLNQPADTLARAEALLLVDRVVRGLDPTPERARHWAELANAEAALPFFDELRALGYDLRERETGNLGLYELTERLIGLFGLLHRTEEQEYLFRFLDLTLEYSLRFGNNLNNFLAYWDQKKSSLSINAPAGRDAITITTVHKAKGLAYGVVLVPFADWPLTPYRGTLLWGRLAAAADKPVADMPGVAVLPQTQALLHTPLAGQYTEELEKTFLEGLNMLYVAFTRPRHRLYAISRRPKPTKAGKDGEAPTASTEPARTVAELLHRYLLDTGRWHDEQMAYVLCDARGFVPKPKNHHPKTTDDLPLTNLESTPWEERLRLKRHANTVFDFDEQQEQREWNRKLHYALRRVKVAADAPRAAQQLVAEGLVSTKERAELLRKLHEVTEHPQMAHYFSEQVQAEAEREILVGGTRKQDYKPDRIVFEAAPGGTGRRVTLLDFKAPPPEPRHRLPLQRYAELFRRLGFEEVRCVLYYFDTQEVVEF
ncbi:UvrD-helicase domain-containing protein [Hymenobacter weizhouensis]|uniref:UvrD-helicase domain-containing protein n=1 Tax=Hymenobacter sp. YIM 151500-1 TaxID=2987689 RepID=UPI002226090A|nr:UvrD-helicase domain-containing protein [Hymenobacter sp. YIM 151500-1]UYZ63861.1 UvrD-helicase domain-containing protein [Hymenobacter sp. YIM 151500-1]